MLNGLLGLIGVAAIVGCITWAVEKRKRRTDAVPAGYRPEIKFPFSEPFELYHNALSLCSMKTRVCLAELQIPYKSHPVDLIETGRYENIRPGFLAINPGGTVPVLLHHGHPIYESHEQIRYLADFAAEGVPRLVPDDSVLRLEMEEWIDRSSLTADPIENGDKSAGNAIPGLTVPLFTTMIEKISLLRIVEGLLFHFDKIRPVMFIALKLAGIDRLPKLGPASRIIGRSRRQMAVHLDALEEQLGKRAGRSILGDQFTLADVSWLVILERLSQADAESIFLGGGKRPMTTAYWERLKARPSHAEAIRGHSHPIIEYGRRRIVQAKAANPTLRVCLEGK